MNWTVNHTISWFDYTMTALAENRYRALKQQIDSLPARSVFDPDCTDADAEVLFEMSFLAREDAQAGPDTKAKLHTLDDLRTRVASGLTAEILLLSPMEHDLFVRTVLFGGKHILSNPALLHPALCLVRRLLCSIRKQDGELILVMPDTIRATSMLILAADNHRQIREKIQDVHDRIDSTLYLIGFLLSAAPERNLAAILKDTPADQHPEMIRRLMLAGYETYTDGLGVLYLVHPGMAQPEKWIPGLPPAMNPAHFLLNEDDLTNVADSMEALESPIYDRLLFLIEDVCRPEVIPDDAVEDLFILAKQGASASEMEEVLSACLICFPTPEMQAALRDLSSQVPRWMGLSAGRIQ